MTFIETLERRVIELAMVRLAEWQEEHPEGIVKNGPNAMKPAGRAFIEACIELQKRRGLNEGEPQSHADK